MENYKIKASIEAVSLFSDLGYDVSGLSKESEFLFAKSEDMSVYNYVLEYKGYQELTLHQLRDLVAQSKNEQGLISGADALRALADGKEVERKLGIGWCNDVKKMPAETILHGVSELRIKPHTIKVELEIPAPFKPNRGDEFYHIWPESKDGWGLCNFSGGYEHHAQFGAWRTEEEIQQVVAALRGGIKG